MNVLNIVLSVGSLVERHFISSCLKMCFVVLSLVVYELAYLVSL